MAEIPKVAFRVDSSLVIGAGHVMRCLMLAQELRAAGTQCHFICADLPGHLGDLIRTSGMSLTLLPAPNQGLSVPHDYDTWSGIPWKDDAQLSADALSSQSFQWLVVDHYGLDVRWEAQAMYSQGLADAGCLVMDDLANRSHLATVLVDTGLSRLAADYVAHVPPACQLLLGPKYAVLRPDFAVMRPSVLPTRNARLLQNVLIAMGGVDLQNSTAAVLDCMNQLSLPSDLNVTVVLGGTAPHLSSVKAQAEGLSFACEVVADVPDMHRLMSEADLAIGAVGGTAWERCVVGLPSLMLSIAENQIPAARALSDAGAAIYLGSLEEPGWQAILETALEKMREPGALAALACASSTLCDGRGVERLVEVIRDMS
ncbi:UDP-2,4-diacetamido-2,4,6-trideoxy-beta-L-altropyranose hydrolase [uncultured Tateyamaria sp.]|uniref:UDP-2,4-diacetamido-2,4, 6-trideoxy-beta-L-altropyranose hydrolase n=1 Tax=uncultured Tateyamaria sp. TaxID=455651 RepID=UPI0026153CBE|nr:UDP-2,4-diacetamido-2,4,6-trideoxy-beta-L-altropyranose hydrolase [uncultured Tateyamaria sp.]